MGSECKFEIGDQVIFREWDDMVAEFGLNGSGDIDLGPLLFLPAMKCLCGNSFAVTDIVYGADGGGGTYDRIYLNYRDSTWAFCPEMFVDYDKGAQDVAEVDREGFLSILFAS